MAYDSEILHQTAIIDSRVRLGDHVRIDPYAVIDAGVEIGDGCRIGAHAHITGNTILGKRNVIHSGCVIGDAPQDMKYRGEPTRLRIGDDNVFREHVTVHRSNCEAEETVVGSNNFLMAHSHVGHNSRVGDNVILANGALLGGHVEVRDGVFISGNCLVHQFVRIGALAFMQGGSAISRDLPPYTVAWGVNPICGLNTVGLRRAGVSSESRIELKKLYHRLFRSGGSLKEALAECADEFKSREAAGLIGFVTESARGVCRDLRRGEIRGRHEEATE
ncbi:MAG: acyl-ACP--UDP-N-acetylglucosamine O-acyltransferase [Verrucomicrobia bacterium]|nr:acyl-ACP--UDP-N-acetylglucosamine O-acyltransferase [Verrucomicrobiota bacterium]